MSPSTHTCQMLLLWGSKLYLVTAPCDCDRSRPLYLGETGATKWHFSDICHYPVGAYNHKVTRLSMVFRSWPNLTNILDQLVVLANGDARTLCAMGSEPISRVRDVWYPPVVFTAAWNLGDGY